MTLHGIEFDTEQIGEFCRRNGIKRLWLFGSILRDDFGPESDVDILVEFQPGIKIGWKFFDLQDELSRILGRRVDLNTRGFLSRYFADEIVSEAQELHVAA